MTLKQKLFSNMFLRNMLADLDTRSAYSPTNNHFIPYFQYKIGAYQPDHYLYFPIEPFALRYKNEIFNKLKEYNGYDIIQYLQFHYAAYPEKDDFLRFMLYEASQRIKQSTSNSQKATLQTVLEWITEQQQEQLTQQKQELKHQIEQDVRSALGSEPSVNQMGTENIVNALFDKAGQPNRNFNDRYGAAHGGINRSLPYR
jgi:hypothetical protein